MTEPDYDVADLAEAYREAKGNGPFVAWSLFRDAYGDDARNHFDAALHNGDITVVETKAGIRADGQWPNYNGGRLWLEFNH